MRIAFVSHGTSLYGAERSLKEIIASALSGGHEVEVYLPGDGPLRGLLASIGVPDGSIHDTTNRRWLAPELRGRAALGELARVLVDIVRFGRLLRIRRPEVVVVNSSVAPAAMFAGRLVGIPVITLARESLSTNPSLVSPIPRSIIAKAISVVSTVVVSNSNFTARQFPGRPVVAYPPVTCCRTDPGPARQQVGPLRIVALGR